MALDIESITSVLKEGMPALEVLAGSKAVALFLEKISGAIGWYVEPKQIVRKARAEAAAGLIKAEAAQEEKTIEQRVAARIIYEETKQQQNIESVVIESLPGINEDAKPNDIDDDWLTNFFDKCRLVSNEEMQKLWSQVLAGEVNQPGSFSPRTVNALSLLTKYEALLFKKMSSYIWESSTSAYSHYMIMTRDMLGIPQKYNFTTEELLHIQSIGLVTLNTVREMTMSSHSDGINLSYNGKKFDVSQFDGDGKLVSLVKKLPIGYVVLTQIGQELASISSREPNWDYMNHVLSGWIENKFNPVEIGGNA